jgi:predicted nucleic acid-binding protein
MVVYVESNFILELAFRQEQADSCRSIIALCRSGNAKLVLPAFSIAEPFHTYVARTKDRRRVSEGLDIQFSQLRRSETLAHETELLQRITGLLVRSAEEERLGLDAAIEEVLDVGEVIPLDADVIRQAGDLEQALGLSPQDAIVLASVVGHLRRSSPERSCFLNRNTKDFDDPDVIARLAQLRCKLLSSFENGLGYVRSSLDKA